MVELKVGSWVHLRVVVWAATMVVLTGREKVDRMVGY